MGGKDKENENQLQVPRTSLLRRLSGSSQASDKSTGSFSKKLGSLFSSKKSSSGAYDGSLDPFGGYAEANAPPAYDAGSLSGPNQSQTSNYIPEKFSGTAAQAQFDAGNHYGSSTGFISLARQNEIKREKTLNLLVEYDTVFLVDDSSSMQWHLEGHKGSRDESHERWNQARDAIADVVSEAIQYDTDGIDLQFFNSTWYNQSNVTSKADVLAAFDKVKPDGRTPIAKRLEDIISPHMKKRQLGKAEKKLNIVLITDGEPDSRAEVEDIIIRTADQLEHEGAPRDPSPVAIAICQIGNDKGASKFLRRLDDELKTKTRNGRDIVDVSYFGKGAKAGYSGRGAELTPDEMVKTLCGGISRDVDAQDPTND